MPEQAKNVMPEVNEADVVQGNNVVDGEGKNAELDGGSTMSIAPSIDSVVDTERMAIAQLKIKKKDKTEKNFKFPKLFVKKEEFVAIKIDILFDPEFGDVYSITQSGIVNPDGLDALENITYTFKFKPIAYDDMQSYRRQASFYDANAKDLVINRLTLRNLFFINHLRYTDLIDNDGEPINLKFDEATGNLDLNSINKIFQTMPALLDVVMTLFERKLMMLFQLDS